MIVLIFFAFLAGLVTVLSPCILPILPIVLSGALSGGKRRPFGVIIGFIVSFTFFAVFSFTLAKALGISPEALRYISVALLVLFGLSLFVPKFQLLLEQFASKFSTITQKKREGFIGGVILGFSLGIVWTPCVGPILASVLTLAATSSITLDLILITLAFSLGTALPMMGIAYGGRHVLQTLPYLKKRSEMIQKVFGILIIVTAVMIYFGWDRSFQTYVLEKFPQYGEGLTKFEQTEKVQENIDTLNQSKGKGNNLNILDMLTQGTTQQAPNPDFDGGGSWINSDPLSLKKELKGKVVLIDFWTYTCINCIRTLPYLKNWYETYKNDGLVIIGVHSPEFPIEYELKNVKMAVKKFGITYPVVQDNMFKIWYSYENSSWPAHYLIDRSGNIRYSHIGEGNYQETENMIRDLLAEGGTVTGTVKEMHENGPSGLSTPETYLGYARIERFASPESIKEDEGQRYTIPIGLPEDYFAYGGSWIIKDEPAISGEGAKIALNYKAKGVYLVMKSEGVASTVELLLDGKKISQKDAGEDVVDGAITIKEQRLYSLVKHDAVRNHELTIIMKDVPVSVYAFSFD